MITFDILLIKIKQTFVKKEMNIDPKLRPVIYAVVVFVVFMAAPLRHQHVHSREDGGGAEGLQAGLHHHQRVQGDEPGLEEAGPAL